MGVLASRLPYDHPYAAGYPGVGSQPLPTDSDAKDYLARVKEKDGVAVEVGVANAVDTFFKSAKASGVYESLRACCIMAGARTISGALVPLRRDYGPELVDINNLPTPLITEAPSVGLVTAWDGKTRTLSVTSAGSASDRPAVVFPVGMVSGRRYRIEGRLSGDTARAFNVGAGSGQWADYDRQTGKFSGTLLASGTYFWLYIDGRQTSAVTIEELSIREDNFTPTPLNLAPTDYVRGGATPGIKGNGTTKYLDTNRASNADGQNDRHMAVYIGSATLKDRVIIGGIDRTTSPNSYVSTSIGWSSVGDKIHARAASIDRSEATYNGDSTFMGVGRDASDTLHFRIYNSSQDDAGTSYAPTSRNNYVFARNDTDGTLEHTDARLAFYSVGSSADLASLDSHVSQLIEDIGNVV